MRSGDRNNLNLTLLAVLCALLMLLINSPICS